MTRRTLVFISPHKARTASLPSRPANLLAALIDSGSFDDVIVVNRLRPSAFLRAMPAGRPIMRAGLVGSAHDLVSGAVLVEHPWPFGRLEGRFLRGLLKAAARQPVADVLAWVADPKTVSAVTLDPESESRWRTIFDAYDAWDRSPLERGERRQRAASDGYAAAAIGADIVFANTIAMRDRLAAMGARDARLLPNACPQVDPGALSTEEPRGLIYVGRIHERFDAALALAVADALPDTLLTIAGPVEREPVAWPALASRSNVRLSGQVASGKAREMIASAVALIVPHHVDAYTRSQDTMKAWDAIAVGTPVISTAIPPASDWPTGLAEVCLDTEAFIRAARKAVDGGMKAGRAERLAFAAQNQWSARAAVVIGAIEGIDDVPFKGPR